VPLRLPAKRRNKYRARGVRMGGEYFGSQKEANRWLELQQAEKAGVVRNLKPHPEFPLWVIAANGEVITVGKFTADSSYELKDRGHWVPIVEDVKAPPSRTEAYRLRKRIVEAIYGFRIVEV
jgi:hypothetical protein